MFDPLQSGDSSWVKPRRAASHDSVLLPCSGSFCEELADALLQRASSLRNSHPSVTVGREERLIQGLIDLARALRPVTSGTPEQRSPQKSDSSEAIPEHEGSDDISEVLPEHEKPADTSEAIPGHKEPDDTYKTISEHKVPEESASVSNKEGSPFRIPNCSYYHGLRSRFSHKESQQTKSLWISLRKRLGGEEISSRLGLENISWRRFKKRFRRGWNASWNTLVELTDRLFANFKHQETQRRSADQVSVDQSEKETGR